MITEDRMIQLNRLNKVCKHPERYHCTQPLATEHQVMDLVCGFISALQPDYVLETGTFTGEMAERIATQLRQNGQGKLITIEQDTSRAAEAIKRLKNLPAKVMVMPSESYEPLPEERYQFAWFDTDNKHNFAKEFMHFAHHIDLGAIVGFHDTGSFWGARVTLKVLEDLEMIKCIDLPTPRGVTFGQVLR